MRNRTSEPSSQENLRRIKSVVDPRCSVQVDTFAVLNAFGVTCPARQQAVGKLLLAGSTGRLLDDLLEAQVALRRAVQDVAAGMDTEVGEESMVSRDLRGEAVPFGDTYPQTRVHRESSNPGYPSQDSFSGSGSGDPASFFRQQYEDPLPIEAWHDPYHPRFPEAVHRMQQGAVPPPMPSTPTHPLKVPASVAPGFQSAAPSDAPPFIQGLYEAGVPAEVVALAEARVKSLAEVEKPTPESKGE